MDNTDSLKKTDHHSVYPLIASVPSSYYPYKGKKKVQAISQYAKKILLISAEMNGFSLTELKKDHRGAPVPDNGIYWSLSHKPSYVAAVCSLSPIGIDIEKISPRSDSLFTAIADDTEWNIAGEQSWDFFFRLFTAKEAAVKTTGEGLRDLKQCRLKDILDDDHLILYYKKKEWVIEHLRVDGHIASITSWGNSIQWKVIHQ